MNWWRRVIRRQSLEHELDRELRFHVDQHADDLIARGVEPKEARRRARLEFGGPEQVKEHCRDARGTRWLDELLQDSRFALRTLRKSPGFALTAVATLALGIGVNSAVFSVVDGLLLRPLYGRSDGLITVYSRSTDPAGEFRGVSYPNYLDLRDGTTGVFESLAAYSVRFVGLDAGEGTRRTLASAVTANYFEVFDQPLALGRAFTREEEQLNLPVTIVSHQLWERMGATPGVLGRSIRVNGDPFTVIGIAARSFAGPTLPGPQMWLPTPPIGARDQHDLSVLGRLRAGTSVETAATALTTVGHRLEQTFPSINRGYTLEMSTPSRLMFFPGPASGALNALFAAALMIMPVIVLLVACLNLANLLLARGHARRRELAIKSSLGGSRGRIIRQLLTEGMLLAVAGGAIGLVLAAWAKTALLASVGPLVAIDLTLPEFSVDWRVIAGTIAFSLLASLVFSASPAWTLTGRAAANDLKRHVGDDARRPRGVGTSNRMMIEQVALSLLLLASGGLFLRSAISAPTADPGFRVDRTLLVEIDPGLSGYDESRGRQSHRTLLDRLRTIPGVEAVSIGSNLPFSGIGESRFVVPAGMGSAQSVDSVSSVIGRDYARVLGLSMLAGRDFTDGELAPGSEPVAIVDDALAGRLWPGESALDHLIQFLDAEGSEVGKSFRVVGVIPAVKHSFGNARPFPHVYLPLGQRYESAMTVQVRLANAEAERTMAATVASVARSVDERMTVLRIETWRDHLNASFEVWFYRAGAVVFSAFGAIALLLAFIGVYGVKSYVVSCRTREFGVRLAIGAPPRALLWQVLREGGRTTLIGVGIGLLLAVTAGRLLQSLLYGVRAVEPIVLAPAAAILLVASLVASSIPAIRATKVDPTVALRAE